MPTINRDIAAFRLALTKALHPPAKPSSINIDLFSAASLQIYSAVTVAYLYFLGWMFLYYYLLNFGIDIFSLDIPLHYFFVYSFATISFSWSRWWWAVCLLGVAVPIVVVLAHFLYASRTQSAAPVLRSILAGILLIVLIGTVFFLGHLGSEQAGEARYRNLRFASKQSYEFDFRSGIALPSNPTLQALISFDPQRRAIPILETTDRIFVLVQPAAPAEGRDYRRSARVVEISRSDVLFTKVKIPDARLQPEEALDLWRE
jgi:hypothetical protein